MKARSTGAGFFQGFAVLFVGSLLGKASGLVREVVFAAAFGSGAIATGFKSAQSGVLVSANLVTGDVLSSAFVPSYAEARRTDPIAASRMLWAYLLAYGCGMTLLATLVFSLRRPLMDGLIPGSDTAVRLLASDFFGTLAWCIPLFGLASIAGYALATAGRYVATSLRATLQTAGLLLGTLLAVLGGGPVWLALGFILAWAVYTAWCVVLLVRSGLLGPLSVTELPEALRSVLGQLQGVLPLAVIPVGVQAAIVAQRVIASHGPTGLIASVDYAQILSDSFVTLVAVPLGFVGLTQLAGVDEATFARTSRRILAGVLAAGLPVTFFVLPLTGTIVQLVYGRGRFDATAVSLTSQVAFGLFCGMAMQVIGYALTRALTARRRNRAVLAITVTGLVAEVGIQSLALLFNMPVFLGFGVSAYGLVVAVCAARLLNLQALLARLLLFGAPGMAVSISMLIVPVPLWIALATIVVAWTVNLVWAAPYREVLRDLASVLGRRLRRTPRSGPGPSPQPAPGASEVPAGSSHEDR